MSDFQSSNTETTEVLATATPTFSDLGLDARIVAALTKNGLTTPTPIQVQSIPYLLEGGDLIASAQTGTGKTAAFMLPALHRFSKPAAGAGRGPRVLVLTPTRELAKQVADAAKSFSSQMSRVYTLCVTGGLPFRAQREALSRPVEVLVATPGRLLDLIQNRLVDFRRLETFVLDEADRMLDMGFSDDVLAISEVLPQNRQTVFFTATMNDTVNEFAAHLLKNPHTIEIAARTERHENIEQKLCYTDGLEHKRKLLDHFLQGEDVLQAIVFTATKRDCEQLASELDASGMKALALHGDMRQRDRQRTVERLRRGHCDILVATDVAARGLDIAGISHVFNFDLPKFAEDYVHRIGRTGRAGARGKAISLVGRIDLGALKRIERFIGQTLDELNVEGLEARFRPAPPSSRRHGQGGKGGFSRQRTGERKFGGQARERHTGRAAFGEHKNWHAHHAHNHANDRRRFDDRGEPASGGHFKGHRELDGFDAVRQERRFGAGKSARGADGHHAFPRHEDSRRFGRGDDRAFGGRNRKRQDGRRFNRDA